MTQRRVIQNYYSDVNNLADILTKLVNSYRLLIGSADELNGIALSKKGEVKDALKRADDLGDIIDKTIKVLDEASYNYMDYCRIKTEVIRCRLKIEYIETEIEEDLKLKE
ncbi:hypothetical protein LGK97_11850 [Clostridium sp. CS001]|uniref:hypothetical protein n=1 Tax=Clostridium sp. CS001 TaxID=2880648 RepID=UPI001CF0F824|nr:hypothetical protein [Clostridium sp. CS001]MCB2290461.1 hypothetical protein [Clostridium sp. CS001]